MEKWNAARKSIIYKGVIQFAYGSSYEGQWENHKMQGKGTFTDTEKVVWDGIFIDNTFETKNQKQLQFEIATKEKLERISQSALKFFDDFLETCANNSDKKGQGEKLHKFFAINENIAEFVDDPYVNINIKPIEKWNEAMGLLKNSTNKKVNVLMTASSSKNIDGRRIKATQFVETGGQVVEVDFERQNNEKINLSLCQTKDGRWVLIYYDDNIPDLNPPKAPNKK